ncbi:tripartite tricarboxylate transporter permease [Pseudorhodoplanes sp.]|uniref:tripartite tricarboxylate transporter permease n=1 Tax=Pseudorhodoplanes sp. TaxID=1934341 RepID=UPI003918FAFB
MLTGLAENLALGLTTALSLSNLYYCFLGVLLGTFVGVLPGIGSLVALSLLLPITFHLPATSAIVMLAGVYYGSTYGGSTASILLNLPGTPSTAVTCLDGYPMSKQGRAGVALLMTTVASFFGATVGILIMTLFSPAIVGMALKFGPAEYFAMMVLGLVAASSVASGAPAKGVGMVVLGIMLGLIGSDLETGAERYTFGFTGLYDGLPLVAVAMGLFGVSEVIYSVRVVKPGQVDRKAITFRSMIPTRDDLRRSVAPLFRGAGIGSFFGALPGTGGVIAAFMSYAVEKKVSKEPERFGKGAIEGIMAPESANNAADQTAFIPTLTLGIPGNVVMALMIGALTIHGIVPGPQLMVKEPELFWGVLMSFWIGNLLLLVLNIPLIGLWIRILAVPYHLLYPAILMFVAIGVYSVNNSPFDVMMVMILGGAGYAMRLLDMQPAPLILGFVLGPLMEENFRRSMIIARGDFLHFFQRPISGTLMAITALLLIYVIWTQFRARPVAARRQA